ncbi:MAG: RING finger protein [Candidatus Thorarchaeota archaeon]
MAIKYTEPIKSETCGICNFELKEGQEILQCPFCFNLFHEGHLQEWFQKSNKCPKCKKLLIDEKIASNNNSKTISESISDEIIIKHHLYGKKKDYMILTIMMSLISLIFFGFAAYFIYLIIIQSQFWFEIVGGSLVVLMFLFYGSGCLYLGFKGTKFDIITFHKDKLIIQRKKKPQIIEVLPDTISKIELEMTTDLTSTRTEKFYFTKIELNVFSTNMNLRLGNVFSSRDEFEGRDYYIKLTEFIKNFYGITPLNQISDKRKKSLIQTTLYIIILFVIPIIALVLLALYFNAVKL